MTESFIIVLYILRLYIAQLIKYLKGTVNNIEHKSLTFD